MPSFDLDSQNYAQMSPEMLSKLLAALKPRAENPRTNWELTKAQVHVTAIKNELNGRRVYQTNT